MRQVANIVKNFILRTAQVVMAEIMEFSHTLAFQTVITILLLDYLYTQVPEVRGLCFSDHKGGP